MVLIPFPINHPLTAEGELAPEVEAMLDAELDTAKLAGDKPLALSAGTEGGPHPWFMKGPGKANADRWADNIIAIKKYFNRPIAWVQPFNEPDWGGWGQGSPQDLEDIMNKLRRDPSFRDTQMAGPTVLNIDFVFDWYEPIKSRVGVEGGLWWLWCNPTRGTFVKACQGKGLGYVEDREKWSAAAVYRAPNNSVYAFLGSAVS